VRMELKAIFNALGATSAIYAMLELMRIISYYWQVVLLPNPFTILEFLFLAVGAAWIIFAVVDNLYLDADLLGVKVKVAKKALKEFKFEHAETTKKEK